MLEETISHYKLLSKLGSGGMGEVYLARDIHLDREVAIKFPSSASLDEHDRARFMREARLASTFQHPNIATIFDFGETSDHRPFLVIELVRGRSLHDLIKKKELSLSRSVDICLDVAKALTEAHSHGILHRDIKPSNIVINNRGQVKVLDFGLAKQLKLKDIDLSGAPTFSEDASLTARGVILGTPAYMSPEQVSDSELDERSDLYSLGVTLYECLTGAPPFKGGAIKDLCAQVLHTEPRKPSELNTAVASEVESVVLKAISKDPNARYGSLVEFADALRAAAPSSLAETRKFEQTDAETAQPGIETESLDGAAPAGGKLGALQSRIPLRKPYLIGFGMTLVAALIVVAIAVWSREATPGPDARNLFERGVEALHNGSILTAKNLLAEAVQTHDSWPIAHARLAEAWFDLDNLDMASRSITAAYARAQQGPKLTREDDLYLKAITSTVDLKHDDSVKSLEEIEKAHPDSAEVIFDTGRSLERVGSNDKAIGKFEKALALNSRSPAVHLRLGVLYGRKRDFTKANEHFDRARDIYQGQQSSEGVTEVSLQRGAMKVRAQEFNQGRADLEVALKQSRSEVPNVYQEVRALIQLSVAASRIGELDRAQKTAEEAFNNAERAGLDYLTTGGRIVLGDVFFRRNQFAKAEEYTTKGLQLAERYRVTRSIATATLNLGSIRIFQNRSREGLELISKAKEYFDRTVSRSESQSAMTLIARTQRNVGSYAEAQKTLETQLASTDKNDHASMADVQSDLGTLKSVVEDFAKAREYFQQASNLYRGLDVKPDLFLSLAGLAASESSLGRSNDATRDLGEAVRLATTVSMRFNLLLYEARIALVDRAFETVVKKTGEKLKAAEESDRTTRVAAKILLSSGLLGLGRQRESEKEAREAIEIAKGFEGRRLLALSQLVLAEALVTYPQGGSEAGEAAALATEARNEFSNGGQRESEWRALLAAAAASARLRDVQASHQLARKAKEVFEQIVAEPGYEGYRSRPDIKHRTKQLEVYLKENHK